MLKLRLHGSQKEISEFLELLKNLEKVGLVEVTNETEFYQDRGKSKYSRKYLDLEMEKEDDQ